MASVHTEKENKNGFGVDNQLDGKENDMGEITWEEAFKTLLVHIGIYDLGKKRWFDEENGLWYDRREHEYITLAEVINRAMDVIKTEW